MSRSVFFAVSLCLGLAFNASHSFGQQPAPAKINPFSQFDKEIERLGKEIDKEGEAKKLEKLEKLLEKEKEKKQKKFDELKKPLQAQLDKAQGEIDKLVAKKAPSDKFDAQAAELERKIKELQMLYEGKDPDSLKQEAPSQDELDRSSRKAKDALKKVL